MKVNTGKGGTITLTTLLAIWSISMVVSLPGLAISPILGRLHRIFPSATDLEIQMLTSLPSLLIIPFVLLAGRLSVSRNKLLILYCGLGLFFLSGLVSLFVRSIHPLIVVNCILGIGAGMVIPLSTGVIADYFGGRQRVHQLGVSSAISNVTLVLATLLAGWLATIDWHYSFMVYLLPGVTLLLLAIALGKNGRIGAPGGKTAAPSASSGRNTEGAGARAGTLSAPNGWLHGIDRRKMGGLMLIYFFATYAVLVITFNLPFLMQQYKLTSTDSGIMISLFFLAIMMPGLFVDRILSFFGKKTLFLSLLLVGAGLLLIYLFKREAFIVLGCLAAGLGYGVIQPVVYNKAVVTAAPERTTLALALVMSVNYLAILFCPFIVDLFAGIFRASGSADFPFLLNAVLTLTVTVLCYRYRDGFVFGMSDSEFE